MKHTYKSGLIGNCAYIAHIHEDSNINWLCWPKFDSTFVFGELIAGEKGGRFAFTPQKEVLDKKQYYIDNTNVLVSEFKTEDGAYRVTDFAPRFQQYDRYFKPLMIIRKIEAVEGEPSLKLDCTPVGDYGEQKLKGEQGSNHIKFIGHQSEIRLTSNIPFTYINEDKYFVLNETMYAVLSFGTPLEASLIDTCEAFLSKTLQYWKRWTKTMGIGNFMQDSVIRSSLVLKLHQYEDTGAVIAASTTSLPESPGSGRNWDYRYCWMRDTYYTLNAFNNIGHFEELEKYFQFIANISVSEDGRFQPLYSIRGASDIVEKELPLDGYLGNQPVRLGNQAHEHIQNDVYGQVLVTLLPLYIDSRFSVGERIGSRKLVMLLLKKIEDTMDQKDAGLWEFREMAHYHCYTYLFHWAGASAAGKIGSYLGDAVMLEQASRLKKIAAAKIEECYDEERGVYTHAIGSPHLDASTLHLITMNYLDPDSERARKHLSVLESELKTEEGLFYRYRHADDFGEPETTFLICAYWYVEALAAVGRIEEAKEIFENILRYTNHVGLLSEDVDAATGSQWGNFPQAYSHVGLVNAASRIANKLDKPAFL